MAAEITRGFVLRTKDYRDTSLLGSFFTADFGNVKAVIKEGRSGRGRYGTTFEPFSLNEIEIYRKKRGGDLHMVTGADLVDRYENLRTDLTKMGTATYMMELIDQMVDQAPHPDIFSLVLDAFNFLGEGHSPLRAARIFEIKLMNALGFMPQLRQCVHCDAKDPEPFYFVVNSGGIVCDRCKALEAPLLLVPKGCVAFLEHAIRRSFEDMAAVKVSQEVGEKLERMMRQFLDHHLAYRPKSLLFLEKTGCISRN